MEIENYEKRIILCMAIKKYEIFQKKKLFKNINSWK